ncbi:MAG: MerR family transcriptional regulator [Pseudobdellovibrionaceae bacterium]
MYHPKEKDEADMGDDKAPGAFRTISEVADELDVQQHVLRFWETKFTQVKPLKRGGGRRYYRPEDVAVLKKIHHLLYSDGYTIRGAQNLIKGLSKNQVAALKVKTAVPEQTNLLGDPQADIPPHTIAASHPHAHPAGLPQNPAVTAHEAAEAARLSQAQKEALKEVISDLKSLRAAIKRP